MQITPKAGFTQMQITPKAGFDWSLVIWGGPNDPAAEECSYCGKPFPDDDDDKQYALLCLWKKDGSGARFCDDCQREWFGVESFEEEQ